MTIRTKILLVVLGLVLLSWLYIDLWLLDPALAAVYDAVTRQKPVRNAEEMRRSLSSFRHVHFDRLQGTRYARTRMLTAPEHRGKYEGQTFLRVRWFQRYRYVVGTSRMACGVRTMRFSSRWRPAHRRC